MQPKSIDETFTDSYATRGLQPQGIVPVAANDNELFEAANDNDYELSEPSPRLSRNSAQKFVKPSSEVLGITLDRKTLLKAAAKTKIVGTNTSIYAWAFPAWLFIQLPLAALGLIFFGLAAAVDGVVDSGGITGFVAGITIDLAGGALKLIDAVTGTNLAELADPGSYATAFTAILFLLALLKLLVIGLIYQLTFVNSIFGKGAGVKIPILILVICGYFFPLTNLFPWFFLWTAAVAIYPR